MASKVTSLSPGSLKVTIRPFEIKEIATLVTMDKTSVEPWSKEMFATYFGVTPRNSKISNKRYALIAEYGVQAVGYALIEIGNKEAYVEIDRIFVVPKYRRREIGTQLLEYVYEKSPLIVNCETVFAIVPEDDKVALDFFKSVKPVKTSIYRHVENDSDWVRFDRVIRVVQKKITQKKKKKGS